MTPADEEARADEELRQAYRRQPQDLAIVESALRLAREQASRW